MWTDPPKFSDQKKQQQLQTNKQKNPQNILQINCCEGKN